MPLPCEEQQAGGHRGAALFSQTVRGHTVNNSQPRGELRPLSASSGSEYSLPTTAMAGRFETINNEAERGPSSRASLAKPYIVHTSHGVERIPLRAYRFGYTLRPTSERVLACLRS